MTKTEIKITGTYNDGNTIICKSGAGYMVTIFYERKNAYVNRENADQMIKEQWMSAEKVKKLIRNYNN